MSKFDFTGFGAIADFAGKLADKIWPDKQAQAAERMKFEAAVMESARNGEMEQLKISMSAILAEANSADPWTSRARPSFLYVIYIMILASIPMGIVSAISLEVATNIATGMGNWLKAIPTELYTLFGVGYMGYVWKRTEDKKIESLGK